MEGGYRYWWAGYYIHSCPKMRYKIDYHPQYVLDPETLTWDLLDQEALDIFDKKHYVSLSKDRQAVEEGRENDVSNSTGEGSAKSTNVDSDSEMDFIGEDDDGEDISLFHSDMPGIVTVSDLENKFDLDHIRVISDNTDGFFFTSEANIWDRSSIREVGSLKSRIAELAAAIGPDLLSQICLDFRRKRQ
ncbi:putative arginine-trna-protein transferase 1 [Diaporthe ampelina]|uniref:Putative arginine-trna-protein transferase 1 n=1 Tax=Diaporthe ampelina TaxID=1214573 RepID=A0A0G2IEI9_9PEZI|nr:putative arginine-trna-protein transferase 1 [Diaporthe ampelina]